MCGHLAKSLLKFQNDPARLVWNYMLLTCLRFNASFTWKISSSLGHSAAVRNGDKELCAEEMSWNLVWGCSYLRRLNWLLRLTAAERGSLSLPLSWLWCLCNCTGSWSHLLIHEKTILTKTLNGLSWRAVLVYLCCRTGSQRWHLGTSGKQSCKEGAVWPWQGFFPVVLDRF